MLESLLYYLKVVVLSSISLGIIFLVFRNIVRLIIFLFSLIFPKKYVKFIVLSIIILLISLIPFYIVKTYIYLIRSCVLIGYVESKENAWIFSWKDNFIFMEKSKLGSYKTLEEAYDESEKNMESEIILKNNNSYDVYIIYEMGLLKSPLSKQLTVDKQISIDKTKINELGYKNYYISYYQGRDYERAFEISDKIDITKDVNLIKKYYSNYLNKAYASRGVDEDEILSSIAFHKLTPTEILRDLEKREKSNKFVAIALIDNKNIPYDVLFNYLEIEGGFRKLVHSRAIKRYKEKLYREHKIEEWKKIKNLNNPQDYKIFRKIHEKYNENKK